MLSALSLVSSSGTTPHLSGYAQFLLSDTLREFDEEQNEEKDQKEKMAILNNLRVQHCLAFHINYHQLPSFTVHTDRYS